jgi:hypothetical protein
VRQDEEGEAAQVFVLLDLEQHLPDAIDWKRKWLI